MTLRLLLFYFFVQQSLAIKHTKARVAQLCNFWNGFIFGRAIARFLYYGCPTGLVCPECHSGCLELRQNPSGFKLRDRRERGYQKKKNTSCCVGFNRWYSFPNHILSIKGICNRLAQVTNPYTSYLSIKSLSWQILFWL